MSVTGFNLRRREAAGEKGNPKTEAPVEEAKVEEKPAPKKKASKKKAG